MEERQSEEVFIDVTVMWPRRITLKKIGGPFNVLALMEGRDRSSTSSLVMLLGGP